MTDQKTFDPFSLWKEFYSTAEENFSKSLEETMKKEYFSESLGRVLDFNLLFRESIDKSSKQYLENMNIPSRDDLANLSSLVVNVDSKVDDLEDRLEESLENQMSTSVVEKEITSLKKEIKDVHSKLDKIFSMLNEK